MKEIETKANEAAENHSKLQQELSLGNIDDVDLRTNRANFILGFLAGAKSQSMSEWISVETPPSNRTYVLTFSKYNGMDICEYKHGCFFIGLERQTTVSMWQPLPPPPQTSK